MKFFTFFRYYIAGFNVTFLNALKNIHLRPVLSFTGGGGKSTLIYLLARELADSGSAVLVTTTTMIYHPEVKNRICDRVVISSIEKLLTQIAAGTPGGITVAARKEIEQGGEHKLKGFLPEEIDNLYSADIFDIILVEADGAKHLPVKAPGIHEPVIPLSTSSVFGVIGLDALGAVIDEEHVFRVKEFCSLTGKHPGEIIDNRTITSLVQSKTGLFKNTPAAAQRVIMLHKADTKERTEQGQKTAEYILKETDVPDMILITSSRNSETEGPVRAVHYAE